MKLFKSNLILAAIIAAAASTSALAADKVVIGYSAPALLGGQGQIQAGLLNGAKAKGWEVVTLTSGGDAQKQLNDINDLIAQKVAAIVAVPDDSAGICQARAGTSSIVPARTTLGGVPPRAARREPSRTSWASACSRPGCTSTTIRA